ncbi:MAG: TrkH family potassium uptake protein [Flavobacteriales bacterium]
MLNYKIIFNLLGVLLMIIGGLMLTVIPVSLYFRSGDQYAMLFSALITAAVGFLLWQIKRDRNTIRKREGYLIVSLGWIVMSLFGMLPYLISGGIPEITNAFFETVSGFTTTGASILNDIESMPEGLLFWRSMTQWIGGMGIIVMTIAILPILGIGGMELFVAEAPGPTSDKIHPRITETAKRLWAVYLALTVMETILLMIGGMSFFDAINHAFTTMATGGYSTKNDSIAHFQSPYIQYIIILFMFLAGTNFTLNYFLLRFKPGKLWKNQEFKTYLFISLLLGLAIGSYLFLNEPFSDSIHHHDNGLRYG